MFLETFKEFDRILQDRLLFRLKQNDIRGNLSGNLRGRIQRVLFNGQTSDWEAIEAGLLQGSISGRLFSLRYIIDLTDNLNSNVKLFADDTSLFSL